MRFLVDGYNVTKRDPATASLPLEAQREALVARLAVRGADLLGAGPVTVVFDGIAGGVSTRGRGVVEVRFSRGESADDVIARLAVGGDVTVVTSDTALTWRVSAEGARVLPADTCFEARRPKRRKAPPPGGSSGLPRGADAITRELKDLWLDDEE